ncbi:MAG TPA: hypothetical protein GXX51_02475 [Firmicutes bacterium]|nr:hypothetical protein [Bacillota bacterium]
MEDKIDPKPIVTSSELENTIRQIRGVSTARLILGSDGAIEEVHVLATQERSPKQIVRDIESACMVRFGVRLDRRKISVARVSGDESLEKLGASGVDVAQKRIELERFRSSFESDGIKFYVDLNHNGRVARGYDFGPPTADNKLRLPASATAHAIEGLLGGACSFVLEDVQLIQMRRGTAVIVLVSFISPGGEEPISGVALVRRDEGEAVVRAVLHAINRHITITYGDD